MKISLILPVYNEQPILQEVIAKYISDLKNICGQNQNTYEVIAVNDGCTDGSVEILMKAARLNSNLRIINFDGRYGKAAAITAGMGVAKGDVIMLADIDITNPVGVLQKIFQEFQATKSHIIHAHREVVGIDYFKKSVSNKFTNFAARLFGVEGAYVGKVNIALYSRDVVDVIAEFPESNKVLRMMNDFVGWDVKTMVYSSAYNRAETKQKVKAGHKKAKVKSGAAAGSQYRDRAREHTSSQVYALMFLFAAIISLAIAILCVVIEFGLYTLLVWVVFLLFLLLAGLFHMRSIMIKRVGIVHNKASGNLYNIKNIVN